MSEKYILTRKELHLGYCKETFRAGAVIELDEARGELIVDGRRFKDVRDLDVLKRQAARDPDNPWIIPFSKEALAEVKESMPAPVSAKKKPKPGENMKVIQSDEDLMKDEIDISDTQVSKKNAAAKEAARQKVKKEGMEIIRGDETVEERIASLKGKNDISSMAERARLKATGSVKMPVVRDDSLGSVAGGSKAAALNAGQPLPSRAEVEAKTDSAKARAASRKADAESRRAQVEPEAGAGELGPEAIETTPSGASRASAGASDKDAEIAALKARLATLEGKTVKRVPVTKAKQAKKVVG